LEEPVCYIAFTEAREGAVETISLDSPDTGNCGGAGCRAGADDGNAGDAVLPAYFPSELRAAVAVRMLRRGQILFRGGDPIRFLYFVVGGEIRLVHYLPDGGEIVLQTVTGGYPLAECSVCLSEYSCAAFATRASEVAALPIEQFHRTLCGNNAFAVAWAGDLAARLRDMYMRQERLKLRSSRERVLHYLACQRRSKSPVRLEFSARTWALELGLTHENLYRTLAALEKEKLLRREGRDLILLEGSVA
jgi:CRP-like cAMP-binding protein